MLICHHLQSQLYTHTQTTVDRLSINLHHCICPAFPKLKSHAAVNSLGSANSDPFLQTRGTPDLWSRRLPCSHCDFTPGVQTGRHCAARPTGGFANWRFGCLWLVNRDEKRSAEPSTFISPRNPCASLLHFSVSIQTVVSIVSSGLLALQAQELPMRHASIHVTIWDHDSRMD